MLSDLSPCLCIRIVYAGYMQPRRIAPREWALTLKHQPAGVWHSDMHEQLQCVLV